MCSSVDLHTTNCLKQWSNWLTIFDHSYWRSTKFIKSKFFSSIDNFIKANVFVTTIKIRFDFAINFVINQTINSVLKIDTIDTIELKRPVSCAKKSIVDQSIIVRKNAMLSEIELKIVFEKNITITKSNVTFGRISLIIKTWTPF